ncbi:MAG TPA: alginate lyase family protein, partial [Campylobacterales bacterium]|nr:alginate lyase family protein [Campylobacterales bacterium]
LENGFSLLFGAYYFENEQFYEKAKEILIQELQEQILDDGAHFELSPMYHQIMLFRVLDCINLVQNNTWKEKELLGLLINKAEVMLGWLNTITYEGGEIPLLNDSANGIAPTTKELNDYAIGLNVETKKANLHQSGYRKRKKENYEIIVDVGNIGPDYIPGHAHSDTFNFELYIKNKPFIVDTGVSTYETNDRRILERSTASHNTIELAHMEQSEVWGAFRVASRAKITNLIEKDNYISALHNGYKKKLNAMHQREFIFEENSIKFIDTIHSKNGYNAIARLHFYPSVEIDKVNDGIICSGIYICISSKEFEIIDYLYAPEFNKTIPAKMVEIKFNNILEVEIQI